MTGGYSHMPNISPKEDPVKTEGPVLIDVIN
jgi:hypothetical protein